MIFVLARTCVVGESELCVKVMSDETGICMKNDILCFHFPHWQWI